MTETAGPTLQEQALQLAVVLLFHGMKRELERDAIDEPLIEGEEATQGFAVGVGEEEDLASDMSHGTIIFPPHPESRIIVFRS